jgi:penicillin-binding protein 1A
VAEVAKDMGIRTTLSKNPAMVLGGLRVGVTPLELAHAYTTLADDGKRVSGSLSAYDRGPVAITSVKGGGIDDSNDAKMKRVVPEGVAQQATQILQTVISGGTGKAAQIGEFAAGKTGTTEHYQDALFVGFTHTLTVAVWMGYPDGGRAMDYEYHGKPVAGGTYPAEIWRDFMLRAKKIQEARTPDKKKEAAGTTAPAIVVPSGATDTGAAKPETKRDRKQKSNPAPKTDETPQNGGGGQAPTPEPPPTDQVPVTPPPQTPPSDGGGGGSGGGQPPAGGQP